MIIEGTASVAQHGDEINDLGPGDFFGEVALVKDTPRTATVTATSPVRTLVVTRQNFKRLIEHQPDIERTVLKALVDRSRSSLGAELGAEALRERVDDLLAQAGRILVRQRALGRLEQHRERDGLVALGDLVAAVDVEGPHLPQLGPAASWAAATSSPAATSSGTVNARSW